MGFDTYYCSCYWVTSRWAEYGLDTGSGTLCCQDALPGYSFGGYSCGPWFCPRRVRGGPRWYYRSGSTDGAEPCTPDGGKGRIHGFGNWTQGPGTEGSLD